MKKPKLILHVGHGKTGTTSLQHYLYNNSTELLDLGYLYPTKKSSRENHALLPAGFVQGEAFKTTNSAYMDGFRRFEQDFQRFWKALLTDIERYSPHTVVLSAEQMFRDFSELSRISMANFLNQYFSSIEVVAYVRSPGPDYLSRLAQRAKTGNQFPELKARKIRKVLEFYEGQFPGCVQVRPFDRKQLLEGDIVNDFISRYLPEALPSLQQVKSSLANTSLPWPLLRGLRELRLRAQPKVATVSFSTKARLSVAAIDYARLHPKKQKYEVRLQPDVEDFIRCSAVDHLWLKERYGVVFADLDYTRIGIVQSPFSDDEPLERIVDFSKCPQESFPIERYLGNGPRFWLSYLYFYLRVEYSRLHRVYVHDSWLWRMKSTIFQRRRTS
jgi:hypothetical protein